ncbi:MAG: DUF799 family lipoprotein [Nitrospirae bacterium]|nr:DUF799 family lipoprotein [Candidatus Manganitrophaceae bacterium]
MKKGSIFPVLVVGLLLVSCALPVHTIPTNPSNPIYTVAVLPMYNATNDVDGPKVVRELADKRIQKWHYSSKPLTEVDQILRDQMGISIGSQLDLTTPQKLGAALGVDGVLYGYLLNFDDVTTGVYNEKRVRAGFRLVDTKTGKTVWAGGRGVRNQSGTLGSMASTRDDGIGGLKSVQGISEISRLEEWESVGGASDASFMKAMGGKLLDKATGGYLKSESEAMLDRIFGNFPAGRGTGEAVQVAIPSAVAPKMPAAPTPTYTGNPFFSYMKLGQKDFTSDMVMTSVMKKDNREMVMTGKLAKGGENFRADLDMTETMKEAKGAPPGLFKMATISKGHDKKSVVLYPDLKKYMQNDVTEKELKEPKITKKKVGEEVVDGRKCDKYQVDVTSADGKTTQGFIWEPKDLKDFIVKSEFQDNDFKQTMELKNVKILTPAPSLFEIPKDYTLAASFIDLMGEKK